MKAILTRGAPEPGGHYAQAIVHGGFAFLAGQLPVVPGNPGRKLETIEEQTRQVLENIDAVLKACGSSRAKVLRTTVFIADISLWSRVNAVYAEFFAAHKPARTVVPVAGLHFGYLVEMDVIAAVAD
jgi:2-iminobutanoate/2-iminopropanoate deaminase